MCLWFVTNPKKTRADKWFIQMVKCCSQLWRWPDSGQKRCLRFWMYFDDMWYQVIGIKYLVSNIWAKYVVPCMWYQIFGTKYLVLSICGIKAVREAYSPKIPRAETFASTVNASWFQTDLKPIPNRFQTDASTWYQILGTKYLVPSTGYQVLGTKYLVPSTWYQQVLGTKYLVPSTGT